MKLPISIDPIRLAKAQREIEGTVLVSSLPSLHDALASDEGELTVVMQFAFDDDHHPVIHLSIQGDLQLQCQRCLHNFMWPVVITTQIYPVHSDQQAERLPKNCEVFLLESESVAPEEIIAQELSLALPLVPMHDLQDCAWAQDQAYYSAFEPDEKHRQRPFSGLADLKKLGDNHGRSAK